MWRQNYIQIIMVIGLASIMTGFFYWPRGDTINEATVRGSENCCGPDADLCHTAVWPCSLLSFWWDRCSIRSPIQDCCWKYPISHLLYFSSFLTTYISCINLSLHTYIHNACIHLGTKTQIWHPTVQITLWSVPFIILEKHHLFWNTARKFSSSVILACKCWATFWSIAYIFFVRLLGSVKVV